MSHDRIIVGCSEQFEMKSSEYVRKAAWAPFVVTNLFVFASSVYDGRLHEIAISGLVGALIMSSPLLLMVLWAAPFRVRVSGRRLSYRRLLGGTTEVDLDHVEHAQIVVGAKSVRERLRPTLRLELRVREDHHAPSLLIINLAVFPRERIRRLLQIFEAQDVRVVSKLP